MNRPEAATRRAPRPGAVLHVALVLLAGWVPETPAAALFSVPTFPTGREPVSVAVADFDRDGLPDLAVANRDPRDACVGILAGRQPGFFAPQVCFPSGQSVAMVIGDFTGDGRDDLAVANDDRTVAVLPGRGDGSFAAPIAAPAQNPTRVAAADFNLDGRLDLLYVSDAIFGGEIRRVTLRHGLGDGSFGDTVDLLTGRLPVDVAAGDLNRDGRPDVVIADSLGDELLVLLAGADGNFEDGPALDGGEDPGSVAILDIDSDGRLDLLATGITSEDVVVHPGRGDGTFGAARRSPAGASPGRFTSGDLDGDGEPDLAIASLFDRTLTILINDGGAAFRIAATIAQHAYDLAAADVDRDGAADLIGTSAGRVVLMRGRGDGSFRQVDRAVTGDRYLSVKAADLDGDGTDDLVSAAIFRGAVAVQLARGDGTFQEPRFYPAGSFPFLVVTGDFTLDSHPDVAVIDDPAAGRVFLLPGVGDGGLGPPSGPFPAGPSPNLAIAADVNGDGRLDLVVSNFGPGGPVHILLGDGAGAFAAAPTLLSGDRPQGVAAGDFDADGILDLAVAHEQATFSEAGSISMHRGLGGGVFDSGLVVPLGQRPYALVAADLDRDGDIDLASPDFGWAANDPSVLHLLMGNGDGTFSVPPVLPAGMAPWDIDVADLDRDGLGDLVVANYNSADVSVFRASPDGSFAPHESYAAGGPPRTLAIGHFNDDRRPDVALSLFAGAPEREGITVLLNESAATPCTPPLDPETCPQEVTDLRITFTSVLGRGAGTLFWNTTHEVDLVGFNVVRIDPQGGRTRLNNVTIPCTECVTGAGASYVVPVPKHRSGRDLFVEMLHAGGAVSLFGPARRE